MKRILLIRDKTHAIYPIALHNKAVVIPSGTKLEFAFHPNTLQHIDAVEPTRRMLANMVR